MDSLNPIALASSTLVPQLRMHAKLKQDAYLKQLPSAELGRTGAEGSHQQPRLDDEAPLAAAAAAAAAGEGGKNLQAQGSQPSLGVDHIGLGVSTHLLTVFEFGAGDFLSLPDWCALRLACRRSLRAAGRCFRGRLTINMTHLCSSHRIVTAPYSWLPTLVAAGGFCAEKAPAACRSAPPSHSQLASSTASATSSGEGSGSSTGFWLPPDTYVVPVLDQEFTLVLPPSTPPSFAEKLKRTGVNQRMVWLQPHEAAQRMQRLTAKWGGRSAETAAAGEDAGAPLLPFCGELRLLFPFEFKWSAETQIPGAVGAAALGS